MKIIWQRRAEKSVDAICDFLARKSPRAADKLFHRITDEVGLLAGCPELAQREEMADGYRSLVVKPYYKVVYRINYERNEVSISDVWDCRQDPKTLKRRIK